MTFNARYFWSSNVASHHVYLCRHDSRQRSMVQERAASQRRMYIVLLLRCGGKVQSVFPSAYPADQAVRQHDMKRSEFLFASFAAQPRHPASVSAGMPSECHVWKQEVVKHKPPAGSLERELFFIFLAFPEHEKCGHFPASPEV